MKKINITYYRDEKMGVYFGYITNIKAVCAQADSIEELKIKLNKYLLDFIERYNNILTDENPFEAIDITDDYIRAQEGYCA